MCEFFLLGMFCFVMRYQHDLDVTFFFSSIRRHTRCRLVTGVQTCALPISHALELLPELCTRAEGSSSIAPRKFALTLRSYHGRSRPTHANGRRVFRTDCKARRAVSRDKYIFCARPARARHRTYTPRPQPDTS